MLKSLATTSIFLMLAFSASTVHGQTIASEDFDGGAMNLTSGFDPMTDNLDEGGGDFFGVGSIGAWPQGEGIPFSLADDSVIGLLSRDPADAFGADLEATFGQAAPVDNNFFTVSDTRDSEGALGGPVTASWTFDISGGTDLELAIDIGGQSDGDSFGGWGSGVAASFTYSIDGGASATAFSMAATDEIGSFVYRAMDNDAVPAVGNGLLVSGDAAVTKLLAEDGTAADNTFLNKSPASGPGAGSLDTFVTAISGTGSSLELTLSASVPFEAFAFDNISINQTAVVPEPNAGLLGCFAAFALVGLARRRRR